MVPLEVFFPKRKIIEHSIQEMAPVPLCIVLIYTYMYTLRIKYCLNQLKAQSNESCHCSHLTCVIH